MNIEEHNSNEDVIEFVSLIRGGNAGILAILDVNGDAKYYEKNGLHSLLNRYQSSAQQAAINSALAAIEAADNLEDLVEFEGGLPVQGSLF